MVVYTAYSTTITIATAIVERRFGFFWFSFYQFGFKCKKPLYGNTYALPKKNTFLIKKVLTLSKLEAILLTVDILIFNTQRSRSMAETIQVHLPAELTPVFEEIREVRAKQFKPTSNKSIVIDAVKDMHKKVTK